MDEVSFEIRKSNRQWIWKKRGFINQKYCQQIPRTFIKKYIKAFAIFTASGPGSLTFKPANERWIANLYLKMLKKHLISDANRLVREDFMILHDNDTTHVAKKVKNWLESKQIKPFEFCGNSSDINPIENAFSQLKRKLNKLPYRNLDAFKDAAIKEWENLDKDI